MSRHQQDFDRDIKRDIRNSPIVREVDPARSRDIWRWVGIGVFLVVVVLFSAWQHGELLRHGYAIGNVQAERAKELETNRHLRLEIETLKSLKRIEQIATEVVGMVVPSSEDAIVLRRVVPSETPPPGIVVEQRGEALDDSTVQTEAVSGLRR